VKEDYGFGYFLNCTGAYADRVARLAGLAGEYILVPFKGFYYKLSPSRASLVRASIYPVPNPDMPFLGVHFTRVVQGDVYIGPTAVPALGRENYHGFSGIRAGESAEVFVQLARMYLSPDPMFRRLVHQEFSSYLKSVYTARARKLVPEVRSEDLQTCSKVGIRPQLVNRKTGKLEMDYVIQKAGRTLHVLNAISPAFTCAFAFAEYLVKEMEGMPA